MRHALVGILFACLPLSVSAFASPPATGTNAAVMPATPIGYGDSDTVVCRAPQKMADSGQLGPQACGTNAEWYRLAMSGKDLAADGKTLIDRPTVDNPKGEGDPDALTCRSPMFGHAAVCRTNRFWADLIKNHQEVDARGRLARGSLSMLQGLPGAGSGYYHADSGWFSSSGSVGYTSQGGDTGMQQSGQPIASFSPH